MDTPLRVTDMLRHARIAHGETEIVSLTIDGSAHRYSYLQAIERCRRPSTDLAPGGRIDSLASNMLHHFSYSTTTVDGTVPSAI
jgi:hypothetical protein